MQTCISKLVCCVACKWWKEIIYTHKHAFILYTGKVCSVGTDGYIWCVAIWETNKVKESFQHICSKCAPSTDIVPTAVQPHYINTSIVACYVYGYQTGIVSHDKYYCYYKHYPTIGTCRTVLIACTIHSHKHDEQLVTHIIKMHIHSKLSQHAINRLMRM